MSAQRAAQDQLPDSSLRLVGAGDEDAISAQLRLLVRALRLPAGESEAIREELESHLRERVRDLEITGKAEGEAVACAASELGDVLQLARRFREARAFPRRRLLMNVSLLVTAGAAVFLSVSGLPQRGSSPGVSVFAPEPPNAEEVGALARTVDGRFEETSLTDVLAHVSESIGMPVDVVWSSLPRNDPDYPMTFVASDSDLRAILNEISEDMGTGGGWTLDFRVVDGVIRIASQDYFDRREIVLASYDLSGLEGAVSGEDLSQLILTFVQPEGWVDNGGDLAHMALVGTRMFVEAPKRYHVQIEWFIGELSGEPGDQPGGAAGVPDQRGAFGVDSDSAR